MQNIALSAHSSSVDIVARLIAIVGVIIALTSLVFTWYQWRHSGPQLAAQLERKPEKRRVGHPEERWTFTVQVWNKGRMPATVRSITVVYLRWRWHFSVWFHWWLRLIRRDSVTGTAANQIAGEPFQPGREIFPREIAPTSYLEAKATIDASQFPSDTRWMQVVVLTGDMRSIRSPSIRPANCERMHPSIRKNLGRNRC